jgi:hypothetical protein
MAHILYSAIDGYGKSVEGFVEATSAKQAMSIIKSRGYANIKLHQEVAISQNPEELKGLNESQKAQLARFKIKVAKKASVLDFWLEVARINKVWLLIDLICLCAAFWLGSFLWVVFICVVALIPFVVSTWKLRHAWRYVELQKKFALGHWDEFTQLAAQMYSSAPGGIVLQFDIDIRLACIKARRRFLDNALEDIAIWRPKLLETPGLFESRVGSIYAASGDREMAVTSMRNAYEISGSEPARALDYALLEARFGDEKVANTVFESIDQTLLPAFAQGFVFWTQGVIQLRSDESVATETLLQAIDAFLKSSHMPAVWTGLAFVSADLAFALAKSGKLLEAQQAISTVWPVLHAHADKKLLDQLNEANLLAKIEEQASLFG